MAQQIEFHHFSEFPTATKYADKTQGRNLQRDQDDQGRLAEDAEDTEDEKSCSVHFGAFVADVGRRTSSQAMAEAQAARSFQARLIGGLAIFNASHCADFPYEDPNGWKLT